MMQIFREGHHESSNHVPDGCDHWPHAAVSAQGGVNGHAIDKNLIFSHLAVGAGYTSQVVLMNPGQLTAVNGTLYLFSQDGTP